MRIWHHTTTDYPYLPPDDEIVSKWVSLPARHFDPVKAADLLHRWIDEWQIAEELGMGLMVNEHHGTPTCINPAGPIITGILARETTTAPILLLGNPIANRADPIRVAEEMAIVDLFSRGRLEVGLVRGVPFEVPATNSRPIGMSERFWEAHDLILKAWTSNDGPFNWTGKYFEHRQVNIWPRPYQQPHPPIWVSTLNPANVNPIADRDYTIATFIVGKDVARDIFAAYRGRERELGREPNPERIAYCAVVCVGDTDDEGRAGAEKIIPMRRTKIAPQFILPPGYVPAIARVDALRGVDKLHARDTPIDELIERGVVFAGNPDTVYEQLRNFSDHVGPFGHLIMIAQSGHFGHDETVKSLSLFSQEVMPRLDELTAEVAVG